MKTGLIFYGRATSRKLSQVSLGRDINENEVVEGYESIDPEKLFIYSLIFRRVEINGLEVPFSTAPVSSARYSLLLKIAFTSMCMNGR